MKKTIKTIKELYDLTKDDTTLPYATRTAIRNIVETCIMETIQNFEWRGKAIKDPATTPAKKASLDLSLSYVFRDIKPLEYEMRDMFPQYEKAFNIRAQKVIELERKLTERFKKRR